MLTVICGLSVLLGYTLDISMLKSVLPGAVEMKPNPVVSLSTLGVCLYILAVSATPPLRGMAQVLALLALVVGAAPLTEYGLGVDFRIGELLFRDIATIFAVVPGRMSPYSAVAFVCLGLGLACLPYRRLRGISAAGRASPEVFQENSEENNMSDAVHTPTIAEARRQRRLILVVEDDEINRKLIRKQLDLLGYGAEMVNNGAEALEQWRRGDYALVLTDLHMPKMDGYMLTRAIRREETGRRVPILALTANALRGEASRALEAGMDEYLTKPVQLMTLRAALEKWLPLSGPAASADARAAAIDPEALKELVGHDETVVREFLGDYLTSLRRLAAEMRTAHTAADGDELRAIAHKLKSSSRAVGAGGLGELCAELERIAGGEAAAIAEKMARFEAAYTKVVAEIEARLDEDRLVAGGRGA